MALTKLLYPVDQVNVNTVVLFEELEWMRKVVQTRLELSFREACPYSSVYEVVPPDLEGKDAVYADLVRRYGMGFRERFILMLALAPHLKPEYLDPFFTLNKSYNRHFTEFGGAKAVKHGGFLPTGETAVYVLTEAYSDRMGLYRFFHSDHFLFKERLVELEVVKGEPRLCGLLSVSPELLHHLLLERSYEPTYSHSFPAERISSKLDWEDLVLEERVLFDLEEIRTWIRYKDRVMGHKGIGRRLKPGFRTLFYGPPGTGKTLSAALLGKVTGYGVYRIDLSMVVSKYIGETEKNLAGIFDQAASKHWILFFDEADALFGQRTATSDAKDRYANQEVAYLLQRIEDFDGVIILATNLKSNLDPAFARRFQSIVEFPMPDRDLRLKLWEDTFRDTFPFDGSVNLKRIADKYEVAGGAIINVLRYCALAAIGREVPFICEEDIVEGVLRELRKDGKTVL